MGIIYLLANDFLLVRLCFNAIITLNPNCNYVEVVSSKNDCQSIKTVDEGFQCCYVEFADEDGNTIKKCHAVEGDQGLQDYADALADYDDLTILCNSIILKISISTLLIGAIVF